MVVVGGGQAPERVPLVVVVVAVAMTYRRVLVVVMVN